MDELIHRSIARGRKVLDRTTAVAQEQFAAQQRIHRRALVFDQPTTVRNRVWRNILVCPHLIAQWRPCTKCRRTRDNALKQSASLLNKLGITL